MKFTIFTDGGARGNPGPAGIGGGIFNEAQEVVAEISQFIGKATNNDAEYRALLVTLTRAKELGATEVHCFLDSQLVVKQMRREYKVKDKNLASLFIQVHNLSVQIGKVFFNHIPREKNSYADRLVNEAIDKAV